uniref:Uncharacterized protein n=1 Tax=Meloidogyne incognita TaxID=6306 RepID=A0A914N3H5_MELIC
MIESYRSNGKATRSCESNRWKSLEFIPNMARMSVRRDGSYSALCSKLNTKTTSKITNEEWLEITAPDFKLRRFKTTKLVEIVISLESSFPGSFVQICLCTDNVIMVKHLRTDNEDGFSLQKNDDKHVCFSYGKCAHITE